MKIPSITLALALLTMPVMAADMKLKSLEVKRNLKAGVPYNVTLPYTYKGGTFSEVQGCFSWSGEGPYCFPIKVEKRKMKIQLRTGNASTYTLSGFVKFKEGNKSQKSNTVSAKIVVK